MKELFKILFGKFSLKPAFTGDVYVLVALIIAFLLWAILQLFL